MMGKAPEMPSLVNGKPPTQLMRRWGITGMVRLADHWRISDASGQLDVPLAVGDWLAFANPSAN